MPQFLRAWLWWGHMMYNYNTCTCTWLSHTKLIITAFILFLFFLFMLSSFGLVSSTGDNGWVSVLVANGCLAVGQPRRGEWNDSDFSGGRERAGGREWGREEERKEGREGRREERDFCFSFLLFVGNIVEGYISSTSILARASASLTNKKAHTVKILCTSEIPRHAKLASLKGVLHQCSVALIVTLDLLLLLLPTHPGGQQSHATIPYKLQLLYRLYQIHVHVSYSCILP